MQGGSDSFCTPWLSSLPTAIPLTEGLSAAERIAGKMARWPVSSCALKSLERTGSRVQRKSSGRVFSRLAQGSSEAEVGIAHAQPSGHWCSLRAEGKGGFR